MSAVNQIDQSQGTADQPAQPYIEYRATKLTMTATFAKFVDGRQVDEVQATSRPIFPDATAADPWPGPEEDEIMLLVDDLFTRRA